MFSMNRKPQPAISKAQAARQLIVVLTIVLFFALVALFSPQSAAAPYSDSFEGGIINSFWTLTQQSGSVTLATDVAKTGSQSVKFASSQAGQRELHLKHIFPAPTQGNFSIVFYDSAAGQETLYEQLRLFNSLTTDSALIGTQDFDAFCYAASLSNYNTTLHLGPNGTCGNYPQTSTTNVHRAVGWHKLEIGISATGISYSIDGAQVFTTSGDYRFDSVDIAVSGPAFRPDTVAYFDDFSFAAAACNTFTDCAYELLRQRVTENQNNFYVYKDADSASNHSFPSGLFGTTDLTKAVLDSACVDDPLSPTGCSTDPARLDVDRGTVFRFNYPALSGSEFVGLNWQDPENFNGQPTFGAGYNLTPATSIQFDGRSPDNAKVQFGVGGCVTGFYQLGPAWTTINIPIADLLAPPGPSNAICPIDLTNTHILFTVATNAAMSASGGTVLLDNIKFLPVPTRQSTDPKALSLPLGNEAFGVVLQNHVTPDQANRNLAPIYEAAATILAFLRRGRPEDVTDALRVADALRYALHHDNHGNPLPVSADGSVGLRSAYQGGDIALLNGQSSALGAQAGDVRLAGFSVKDGSCGRTGFCLVLDGATGGNNAWAMLALQAAYLKSGSLSYLNDAETIGRWIVADLKDSATLTSDPPSYGGYFVGFADGGSYFKILGKSTENNGDIFVAFSLLAQIENGRGNTVSATQWQSWANVAGDFVMQMFDSGSGRFYAGTVTVNPPSPPNPPRGNCQTPLIQKGNDIINTCDFLDSNTFTLLPMAGSPRYRDQIDWRIPVRYVRDHFAQTVTVAGHTYSGFDIVTTPSSGRNGIAWEFTGQYVVAARFVDSLYNQSEFKNSADATLAQIKQAQSSAPFGDGLGLPASTLQDGDMVPPLNQCLDTPFQCIPERVGLAATNWALYAAQAFNPLWFSSLAISPLTPPFPLQLVGTTSPASKILMTNMGTAPVNLSGISITGSNNSDFVEGDDCHASLLAPGAICTVSLMFKPSAAGQRTATLVIMDDALGGPQTIPLVGTGLPLDDFSVSLSPDHQSLVAGTKATYAVQTQITRGSTQPIVLSVSCPGLTCNIDQSNISAGAATMLTVVTTIGTAPKSYSITVAGTGSEVTHTIDTDLSVTAAARLSSPNLVFATQQIGSTSTAQAVTLTNSSPSPLSINAISVGGAFSADFAQTNNCASLLGAGASCTINITFTPTGVAGRKATLFVFDGAGDTPQTAELRGTAVGACAGFSDCGFQLLNQLSAENRDGFRVYQDGDSGVNKGFPSGLFFSSGFDPTTVTLDSSCIDDPLAATGCATDQKSLDATRGTVFRITFPPLLSGQFAGLNFQDPQNYDPVNTVGKSYDLAPATAAQVDVRSPDSIKAQFGVGNCVSDFFTLSPSWQTLTIPFNTLKSAPGTTNICPPDIRNTHLLFTVATNVTNAPHGGTLLLDNIQFLPIPERHTTDTMVFSLPVATKTMGVVPNQRLPIPPDQVNRNLATISEAGPAVLALLTRRRPGDIANALKIADALSYALYHDNHGDPIPTTPQSADGCYGGSTAQQCGLHSAYINGDIAFLNNQPAPAMGQSGDVRLAGFSSGSVLCGPSGFCLVLDGATGGDNAWAIMALVAAYNQSSDPKYLNDAIVIGNWISANLADSSGYGGYFLGYNDGGLPKQLILGKSTAHNAQIFVAFSRLARAETARGNSIAAVQWTNRANAAANFVLQMFDAAAGRFYSGTVNTAGAGIQAPGLCPDTSKVKGQDVVNSCDSLDSNTSATLALAASFPTALDWTRALQYGLNHFTQTVTAGGKVFSGFDLVPPQGSNQFGVAWQITSQMALAMNIIGGSSGSAPLVGAASLYRNQIQRAQMSAPFGDGKGLVQSTLLNGDMLPPYGQCLKTPFQCIPERVGLAATAWGIFSDLNVNPLQVTPGSTLQFSAATFPAQKTVRSVLVSVTRSGDTNSMATVDYATSDGTATQVRNYIAAYGTLVFAPGEVVRNFPVLLINNLYVEGPRTVNLSLSGAVGAALDSTLNTAQISIADPNLVQPTTNPLDAAEFFVNQHYLDFLSRQPDPDGFDYWTRQITQCGTDPACLHNKRIDVSNAFFFEQEYQQTAAYVFRLYRAAFGNTQPFPNPDPANAVESNKLPGYVAFAPDRARVIGGTSLTQSQLAVANTFVQRAAFLNKYPASQTGPQFVDAILGSINSDSGVDLSLQRGALIALYNQGGTGMVLYRLADDNPQTNPINNRAFVDAEYNRAFVTSQYFGYLRRDADIAGHLFWLGQVNRFALRDIGIQHAMVCSFITAAEYQQRFSPVVTHTNAECPH